jgi:hypothetical protein
LTIPSRCDIGVLSRFIVDMLAPVGVFRIVDWLRQLGVRG